MSDSQLNMKERVKALTEALRVESDAVVLTKLYIERAHCFNLLGDEVKSVEDYLKALEFADNSAAIVHIRAMIALAFLQKDHKESALWWAFGAVDENRDSDEAQYAFGLACQWSDFLTSAIEAFKKTLTLRSDHRPAMIALGTCLREEGRLDEAVTMLSKYVAEYPDDPRGLFELGWTIHVHVKIEDRKTRAMKLYDEALKHKPPHRLQEMINLKRASLSESA